jgi:hypothetical protein
LYLVCLLYDTEVDTVVILVLLTNKIKVDTVVLAHVT